MALFLVAVLGGIAVFISLVTTMQIQSSTLDEEGSMTYHAARSGIEWGVYQAIINTSSYCTSSTSTSFTIPITVSLTTVNYNLTVTCTPTTITEGTTSINIYQFTSTANNAGTGNNYIERQLIVTASKVVS